MTAGAPSAGSEPRDGRSLPRTISQSAEDFNDSYASPTPAPWDIGRPQPAFMQLAEAGGLIGRVLDVGCGTGEHALLAASLGREALGVDIAPRAIELARLKAAARGLEGKFLVHDALRLAELDARFDTVLDCGLFHGFDDHERRPFVDGLAIVLRPGGRYHMLCFSDRQPGNWGPRRITQADIRALFAEGWTVASIEATVLDITIDPAGALAWHATITRQ
jgi:SAM-dependent methyltransferase